MRNPPYALGAPILCMRNPRHAFCAAGTTPTCTWGSNPLHGNKIHPMLALLALNHSIAYPSHSYLLHALCTPTPVCPPNYNPIQKVDTPTPCMSSALQPTRSALLPPACTPHSNPPHALHTPTPRMYSSRQPRRCPPELIRPHPTSPNLIRTLPTSSNIIRHHPISSDLIRHHPTSSELI